MLKKIVLFSFLIVLLNSSAFAQTTCATNSSDSSCINTASTTSPPNNISTNPNAPIVNNCTTATNQDSTCLANPQVQNSTNQTVINDNSNTYTKNCKNPDVDSTCFQANILQYQTSPYHSLPVCNNTSPGYYQNPQPPGGCLYKPQPTCIGNGVTPSTWNSISDSWSTCGYIAPPQCPNGQNQTSAPYWDTLSDTWQGLGCTTPPSLVYVCIEKRHPFWCGVGGNCVHWVKVCSYVSSSNVCVSNPNYSNYWFRCVP
jgi:hypothetical protein